MVVVINQKTNRNKGVTNLMLNITLKTIKIREPNEVI